ncbi:leucyl aminopeptidase [Microterricola pindariensis]|uniref:Probable cytosol aminopeptidase n=1 Tax=Microterricola pindariensis TaxID=478010 RepID=A0ABX5AZ60_9MICO|nr:leucyl aminopeptidase [Microterricola pindariensis]PPL19671.1 leucyl aminopeptidase [Microterricola pindariensis]
MPELDHTLIPGDFARLPSQAAPATVVFVDEFSPELDATGYFVAAEGDVAPQLGATREQLAKLGFEGKAGQTQTVLTASGALAIAVGLGSLELAALEGEQVDADAADAAANALRDAGAAFARAAASHARIGLDLASISALGSSAALDAAGVDALVEGVLLARYRFNALKAKPKGTALETLELRDAAHIDGAAEAVRHAVIGARAANVARDLCNNPPGHLTATNIADLAVELAAQHGFSAEVFDKQALIELGCGGLLGVNAGSHEEPRMVKLHYTPASGAPAERGHLALVGKGIMYDSGGISLKPSDPMHLLMKMDMGGAAAVLGAFTALRDLGVETEVTGFLMCTDNMPSGTATKLGDVLIARNGTTVEVKNTDAEGRLVMMDALALAAEEKPDAIVDIATLTGAVLMALGQATAGVIGNNQDVVDQLLDAAATVDEPAWQLPLEKKYRKQLDSDIADLGNIGGRFAGATTAALFLNEFVDGLPWAHLDIAGTMQSDSDDAWRSAGATGYGARLLADFALNFTPVQ